MHGPTKGTAVDRGLGYSRLVLRRQPLSIAAGGGSLGSGPGDCRPGTDAVLKSSSRNVHSWTALISHHTRSGQGREALRVYEEMRKDEVEPNPYTFVALLKACCSLQDLDMAKQIHAEVVRCGIEADLYVGTMLVDVYAKCGSLVDARRAFEKMPHHDVVSWNAMILRYAQMDKGDEALHLYAQMQHEGVAPDERTYVSTLKACRSLAALENRGNGDFMPDKKRLVETVAAIHADIRKGKFDGCLILGNMLIDVYAKCGSLEDARNVFEKMPQRSVVSWNTVILGYAQRNEAEEALHLYTRMQEEGPLPNDRTCVSALKACSSLAELEDLNGGDGKAFKERCLEIVRGIHTNAVKGRFDSDVYVGNMLVDLYSKCGSLEDARHVFENMPRRTVVSWTSMILGYAQKDKGEEALKLFARMKREGYVPDDRTYIGALKACISLLKLDERIEGDSIGARRRCLEAVQTIHEEIVKGKCQSDVYVGTMLVDVYAKCGNLKNARFVFEKMSRRDVVCWNALILGYAQMDKGEDSLHLYDRMQQEGVIADDRTYIGALKACGSLAVSNYKIDIKHIPASGNIKRCLDTVRNIHRDVLKGRFESDVFVGTMLVDSYAKCGSLEDARQVFDKMLHTDAVSWNAMILGYAHMDAGDEALQLYNQMQIKGVAPDHRTFVSLLKACSTLAASDQKNECEKQSCLETVRAIHADILARNFDSDLFVGNMLVDVYAKCGSLECARLVFENMPHRSVASWTTIISGYAQTDEGEEALHLFARMQEEGLVPDGRTYVTALRASRSLAELEENEGGDGTKKKCLATVRGIHGAIVQGQFESDVFVGTMLVDVYAKCGSLEDARSVFEKMPRRTVVSWNAMILGYAQMDEGEEALHLYTRMQQEGVVPDDLTYIAALSACANVVSLQKGKEIHAQILNAGLVESFVANALIDMFATCGSMLHAQAVFDALPTRGIAAWSALISGYAHQGESELVFHLFQRMTDEDIQPNGSMFLSLLTACSHGGLVDKGQQYFEAMSRDYGITPTIKHFTCVVDLLGRAGHLNEAMEVVKAMPFEHHSALWRSILAACRKWRNVELGRHAFECAVRLDKSDAAAYILMASIYAGASMQEEAKQIQSMKVKSQAWKQPGQSWWTDMSGITHVFLVGDRGHLETQQLYDKLEDVVLTLRNEGRTALDWVLAEQD